MNEILRFVVCLPGAKTRPVTAAAKLPPPLFSKQRRGLFTKIL
jgi:hypothetical protein